MNPFDRELEECRVGLRRDQDVCNSWMKQGLKEYGIVGVLLGLSEALSTRASDNDHMDWLSRNTNSLVNRMTDHNNIAGFPFGM